MNRILNSEFFWGIIIGVVLTIFGAYIQSKLYEVYDSKKYKKELSIRTCNNMNARYVRCINIISSSSSDVFGERWTEYITEGVYPWNSERSTMEYFIKKEYPDFINTFQAIHKNFLTVHHNLTEIRRLQGTTNDSTKQILEENRNSARDKCKEIRSLIDSMEKKLLIF